MCVESGMAKEAEMNHKKRKHSRLLRELGVGEATGRENEEGQNIQNGRQRKKIVYNKIDDEVESDGGDNDDDDDDDFPRVKRNQLRERRGSRARRNVVVVVDLEDTEDEDENHEENEENGHGEDASKDEDDDDSVYEEEQVVSPPKPSEKPIKKSWKTVAPERKQPNNPMEKFGFVPTDKKSAITNMDAAMPKKAARTKANESNDDDDDNDDDEEFVPESKPQQQRQKRRRKTKNTRSSSDSLTTLRSRKSERETSKSTVSYADISSGDEDLLLSSDEDDDDDEVEEVQLPTQKKRKQQPSTKKLKNKVGRPKAEHKEVVVEAGEESKVSQRTTRKRKSTKVEQQENVKNSSDEVENDPEEGDEDDDDAEEEGGSGSEEFQYRIEHILGSKKLTAKEWRGVCENMTTLEITRGSVLKQPDDEYFSTSPELVEKFLIKWCHCSYLHVSWETQSDLETLCGNLARKSLTRYFRQLTDGGVGIFDDLRSDEYFPPTLLTIERVLDLDDETVDIQTIDWQNAVLPKNPYFETSADEDQTIHDDSTIYLHSKKCFLTVKWENLPYCDCSFEDIDDLRKKGIEYESALRDYFRREQLPPAKNSRRIMNRKIDPVVMQNPPSFKVGELRDYQWDGVRWLLYNWSSKRNSILADEMGLGKTIQAAAFLQILSQQQGLRGPFLIVAPLSTLVNWQREMNAWTTLDSVIYHGSMEDRKLIREHEFFYMTRPKSDGYRIQIVITSPEALLATDNSNRHGRLLSQIHWDILIIDEAHRIKNHASKTSTTLRQDFTYSNCVLLTGTPLQNNTEELWTLLNFVDPVQFESRDSFNAQFGDLKDTSQLELLQDRISPYLLRRVKENVEKSVPPKEEILIEVELTIPQKQYYRALYEQNKSFLFRNGSLKEGPRLTNLAMELRKCCNHPYLVKGAEEQLKHYFAEGRNLNSSTSSAASSAASSSSTAIAETTLSPTPSTPITPTTSYHNDLLYSLVQSSGKFVLLDKLLPKLAADGHRVLIFSQFRIMLDLIEDYLHLRNFSYDRIDGAITGRKRQAAIDKFCQPNSNLFIMLLSTRAGGVGINLTPADTVIIYDSDWNPQNDLQAMARAHRIGQTKSVKVYRLLTRKSYELRMFETASKKLGLDYAIMHNIKGSHSSQSNANVNAAAPSFTSKELEILLREGAYDIFREEKDGTGDQESRKFCEEDIDQILSRATVIIHDESEQNQQLPIPSFSKASFVRTGSQCNVDVNDPDFWSKVVGLTLFEETEDNTRHRKCKSLVNSYSVDKIKDDSDTESDPNFEPTEEPIVPTKSKRPLKVMKFTPEPADWNTTNLITLSNALSINGYFNWERIQLASRLRYSLEDIASGSRILILALYRFVVIEGLTDLPETTLRLLNESKFFRLVLLSYCKELEKKNLSKDQSVNNLTPEDEILLEYYKNSSQNIYDHYIPGKSSVWTVGTSFTELYQRFTSVTVPETFVSTIRVDSKLRAGLKAKLSLMENHFEIAHAIKLDQLHAREQLVDSSLSGRYTSFDPFKETLLEFLTRNLLIEDSPAEWWVTGSDDYLMMTEVDKFGFPNSQQRITALEVFMMTQNPGPKHRTAVVDTSYEFLVGGSGYLSSSTSQPTNLAHLEKMEIQRRLRDIISILRPNPEPPCHFYSTLFNAVALYGWPTESIMKLSEKDVTLGKQALVLRPQYLPNWNDLAKITCAKIIRKDKLMESCQQLPSISPKPASCMEKSFSMNVIKVFLSLHDDQSILQIFETLAANTQNSASVPTWWTPHHDLKLLKLVCRHGLQWKVILEDDDATALPISLLNPMPNYVVPVRDALSKRPLVMDRNRLQGRFNFIVSGIQVKKYPPGWTFSRPSTSPAVNGGAAATGGAATGGGGDTDTGTGPSSGVGVGAGSLDLKSNRERQKTPPPFHDPKTSTPSSAVNLIPSHPHSLQKTEKILFDLTDSVVEPSKPKLASLVSLISSSSSFSSSASSSSSSTSPSPTPSPSVECPPAPVSPSTDIVLLPFIPQSKPQPQPQSQPQSQSQSQSLSQSQSQSPMRIVDAPNNSPGLKSPNPNRGINTTPSRTIMSFFEKKQKK